MRLKTTKNLIMLVALAALLSVGVFILIGCEKTEASKSDQGQETAQVKACDIDCTNPCCAAKKEAKTCPAEKKGNLLPAEHPKLDCGAKKEGNPHSAEHSKLDFGAKKEGNPHSAEQSKSGCQAKKEAKTCGGK